MFSMMHDLLKRSEVRKRTAPRRQTKLAVESLEERRVLTTVTMTDYEQLILELVNRARANPQAEVDRNSAVTDLNQGVTGTPITSTPKQPLASLQVLVNAGEAHALDMLANDYFSHFTGGEPIPAPPEEPDNDPTDRAAALGYSGPVGENIAWNGSTGTINQTDETYIAHDNLFESPSHRKNMLVDTYEHAGIAVEFGQFFDGQFNFNAAMTVQEFGFSSGNPYLTGVVFNDSVNDDDFYSIGESEGGVRITAIHTSTGRSYWTTSGPSGGYQVKVPAGNYNVVASGGSLDYPMIVTDVEVSSLNEKVDFDISSLGTVGQDLVGVTGNQFWVSQSFGSFMGTAYYGSLASSFTYDHLGAGDFNGDGLDDLVARASNGNLVVSLATGNGSFITSNWGNFATVTTWATIRVGDFNGDGLDDVMGRADNDGSFWLAKSNGNGFTNSRWGSLSTNVGWLNMEIGDFTGDGHADIAGRADDGTWWISRSNGIDRLLNSYWGRWSNAVQWSDITVGDYDNDGRDDIMGRVNNTQFWVNRSSENNFFFIEYWGRWADVGWEDVSVGDFDGDGDDDVAGRVGGQWWIATSSGANFTNQYWGLWSNSTNWSDVLVIDINGDDNDDLIGRSSNGQWWVSQSTGAAFNGSLVTAWSAAVTWSGVTVGNFA